MERKTKMLLIGKGVIFGYLFMLLEMFIYSALLAYTSISESSMDTCVFIFSLLSVFITSSLVCIKIKENGMKNGGIVGLLYILLVYFINSIALGKFLLTTQAITTIIFNMLLGMIGGIVGVNIASK